MLVTIFDPNITHSETYIFDIQKEILHQAMSSEKVKFT